MKSARVCRPELEQVLTPNASHQLGCMALPPRMTRCSRWLNWSPRIGVVEEKAEVGEQAQVGVDAEDLDVLHRAGPGVAPRAGEAVALGVAAVGGVDVAEAADQPAFTARSGDLVAGVPLVAVAHAEHRELRRAAVPGVSRHAAELPDPLRPASQGPSYRLTSPPTSRSPAPTRLEPPPATRASPSSPPPTPTNGRARRPHQVELGAAGAAEVAQLGVVHAQPVVDVVHQLGDEEIEVGVALAVGVRGHVDRHALDPGLEVGAVVEIEAADEILVGLAVTRVLGDDHAGHGLEQLAFAGDRAAPQVRRADPALRGRAGDPDQIVGAAGDGERIELHHRGPEPDRYVGPAGGERDRVGREADPGCEEPRGSRRRLQGKGAGDAGCGQSTGRRADEADDDVGQGDAVPGAANGAVHDARRLRGERHGGDNDK